MKRSWLLTGGAITLAAMSACESDSARITGPVGQDAFARYVSIGTSVSMGVQSDGVVYSTQQTSWPALLAHQAFATSFTQPLIQGPGCYSPLIAPLQFTRRLSGAVYPNILASDQICALFPNITLPTNNVAVDGARAYEALRLTPDSLVITGVDTDQRRRLYKAVLAPGKTQVTSMMAQNPTLVSVEIGANEVLRAVTGGILIPATRYRQPDGTFTYFPITIWQPEYDAIIDSVAKTGAKGMLMSVPLITSLISVRDGDDFYQDRAALQSFGIIVSSDCSGNKNQIYVFGKMLTLLAATKPVTFSCTNDPTSADFILTPSDTSTLNTLIRSMNSHIQSLASSHGYAYLDVNGPLSGAVATRPPFSVVTFLTCTRPFGQYISLDGVHPTADGSQVIANAAADALNSTYGFAIPKNVQPALTNAQICP